MATITTEKDIFGKDFQVGTYVMVRCLVTAITPVPPGGNTAPIYFGGSGDSVSLTVETPNPQDKAGVTLVVSPTQCRFAGSKEQA
jgi:hypothetical protein